MTTKFVDSFLSNFAYETIDSDTRMLTTGAYKGIRVGRDGKISGENFRIEVRKLNIQMSIASRCIPVPMYAEEDESDDTEIEDKTRKAERVIIRNYYMIQLWLIHALVWYDDDAAWIKGNKGERGRNFAVIAFMRLFKNKKYCKLINSMYRKCDPTEVYLFPLDESVIFNLSNAACYFPQTREQTKIILNEKVNFKMFDDSKALKEMMDYANERFSEYSVEYRVNEIKYLDCRVWFYEEFKNSLESIREKYDNYVAFMKHLKVLKWTLC